MFLVALSDEPRLICCFIWCAKSDLGYLSGDPGVILIVLFDEPGVFSVALPDEPSDFCCCSWYIRSDFNCLAGEPSVLLVVYLDEPVVILAVYC